MSEAAALYVAQAAGFESVPQQLLVATAPIDLTSRYEKMGMLDIHRVKAEGDVGVTKDMFTYIGAITGVLLDPLNKKVHSFDGRRWDGDALTDQIFDRKKTQGAIAKSLLSKEAKTGKISNLSLEAVAPEELHEGVLAKANTVLDSQKSRQHFTEFAMYYALRGDAVIGGDDAELTTFIGVFPYLGTNNRGDDGPRFLVKPFDAPVTDRSPQRVTKQRMSTAFVGGSTYRTNQFGAAPPAWVEHASSTPPKTR